MHRSLSRSDQTQETASHKLLLDIQKLEREKRIKRREEMKTKASPLQKKWNMPKKRSDRPTDPQPASEGRPSEREVEVLTITETPQMGEAVPGALPLVVIQINGIGNDHSISPFLNSPSIQHILESEMRIRPSQASIWSQVNGWGFIERRIQIECPLHGNYVTITPEFSNHFIIVSYLGIREAPPLPSLSLIENARLSVNRPEVES